MSEFGIHSNFPFEIYEKNQANFGKNEKLFIKIEKKLIWHKLELILHKISQYQMYPIKTKFYMDCSLKQP